MTRRFYVHNEESFGTNKKEETRVPKKFSFPIKAMNSSLSFPRLTGSSFFLYTHSFLISIGKIPRFLHLLDV
jgi:hypothetical protein